MENRIVYFHSSNVLSSLGYNTSENFNSLKSGKLGVDKIDDPEIFRDEVYGSRLSSDQLKKIGNTNYSKLENMMIWSIQDSIDRCIIPLSKEKTVLILSSTKGNVDLLTEENSVNSTAFLHHSTEVVANYFGFKAHPFMVSNACISGVLALNMGCRLIESGLYENAIVCGADIISEFVVSGFSSLMAIGDGPCRPYDKNRNGINLGEGCASIILSSEKSDQNTTILGGYSSNDANHISGPSRTGDGLLNCISKTLHRHGKKSNDIDLINAHGTATLFNDDMESKAFSQAGMKKTPLHSLKGYYGHTLGAAGVIESAMAIEGLLNGIMLKSAGFSDHGTAETLSVLTNNKEDEYTCVLKTASGFGGCNAALLIEKTHG